MDLSVAFRFDTCLISIPALMSYTSIPGFSERTAPVKSLRTNLTRRVATRLHHQLQKNMPPQRRPLAPLNNDRIQNNELGIYRRGQIEGLRKIGLPMATISRVLDIPKSSVQYTIELSPQRLNGASISRSGRPKLINERTKAHILRLIRQ
ncbi:hypothetical protein BJX66DRAFT_313127, partial [Aspergillus keveii]